MFELHDIPLVPDPTIAEEKHRVCSEYGESDAATREDDEHPHHTPRKFTV
jgi:hypothetical protein